MAWRGRLEDGEAAIPAEYGRANRLRFCAAAKVCIGLQCMQ